MKKVLQKIILVSIMAFMAMQEIGYCKEMVKAGNTYYLIDENDDICRDTLYNSGHGIFYFGDNGKMKVGWWKNPKENNDYFFCNVKSDMYGAMAIGLYTIDGYLRYFGDNGALVKSKNGGMVDVLGKYTADSNGYLYDKNGNLMRDVSTARSDFYTDITYYDRKDWNNKTLAYGENATTSNDLANNNVVLQTEERKVEKTVKVENIVAQEIVNSENNAKVEIVENKENENINIENYDMVLEKKMRDNFENKTKDGSNVVVSKQIK